MFCLQAEIIDGNYVLVPDRTQYEERFKHFSNFYEKIKGKSYPLKPKSQYELRYFPEQELLILGLNSAWKLNHHDNYKSRASINPEAFTNALKEINENPTYRNSRLKIAVWHHPLNSPDEDRIKDRGFLQRLAQNGFRLALHGHIHKAGINDYKYRIGSKIEIIAAGTFGAPVRQWQPGYPLQYNLLKWQDRKLTVYTRKRIELNGAWQPDGMWVQADGLTTSSYYKIELDPVSEQARDAQINNTNPFQKAGPLPPDAPSYIQRECDRELAEALETNKQIAIVGEFQIGKSSLLNQVMNVPYLTNTVWQDCYIDFQGMSYFDASLFMREFFEAISSTLDKDIRSWPDINEYLEHHSLIFRIDEFGWLKTNYDIVYNFITQLYKLTSQRQNIRIVITLPLTIDIFITSLKDRQLRNPRYLERWKSIKIKKFNEKEIRELLNLLPGYAAKIANRDIDRIVSLSLGEPKRIQKLCYTLFEADRDSRDEEELEQMIQNSASYEF